jgi:hypothetical protein
MSALALGLALTFAYVAIALPLAYFVGALLRRVRETQTRPLQSYARRAARRGPAANASG